MTAQNFALTSSAQFETVLKNVGLNQNELCERLGVTPASVSGWKKKGAFPQYVNAYLSTLDETNVLMARIEQQQEESNQRVKDAVANVCPLTESSYWDGVEQMAKDVIERAFEGFDSEEELDEDDVKDAINDNGILHEAVDGDEWIIYNRFNYWVCQHSDNDDYAADNGIMEGVEGLDATLQAMAFWALYADVQEEIDNQISDMIEAENEKREPEEGEEEE